MVFCHQKPKHCFVACCAALLGKSTVADQAEIVEQFPDELCGPLEGDGVPVTWLAAERVLIGLRLCDGRPQIGFPEDGEDFTAIIELLQTSSQSELESMILVLYHPTIHAILPRKAHPSSLEVMDPAATDFSHMDWDYLRTRKPHVLILKKYPGG